MLVLSLIGPVCFLACAVGTYILSCKASGAGLIDTPNQRSSHSAPTPRGAGLVFSLVYTLSLVGFLFMDRVPSVVVEPILYGAPIIVLLGWLDDRYSLSARIRLSVHFLVAFAIYVLITNGLEAPVQISFMPKDVWLNALLGIFFIAWFINLYNFMDGSDGMAGSMAVTCSVLLASINFFHGIETVSVVYGLIVYTIAGFLVLNWQPARIFMGDTGSYFLGFLFATLALTTKIYSSLSFYSHIIILVYLLSTPPTQC